MRLLVSGGRDYQDFGTVFLCLEYLVAKNDIEFLVHGDCHEDKPRKGGADQLANEAARQLGIQRIKVPANWERHNKSAGPIRNNLMWKVMQPTHGLIFPGGPGTQHMTEVLEKHEVNVLRYFPLKIKANRWRKRK